jgi:hypothetical protein
MTTVVVIGLVVVTIEPLIGRDSGDERAARPEMVEDPIDHLGIIPKVFENIARTDYVVLAVQLQFRAPVSVKGPDMVECRQPLTEMRVRLYQIEGTEFG